MFLAQPNKPESIFFLVPTYLLTYNDQQRRNLTMGSLAEVHTTLQVGSAGLN
jgi:hypothetical protein